MVIGALRINILSTVSFFYDLGLTRTQLNRTFPEIMHINRDGYLPDVQVYQDNNVTVISFAVCLKLADSQFNNIRNYSTPFIVLALDQVLYYTNID